MTCAWCAAPLALGGALLLFASLPSLTELPQSDRCADIAELTVCPDGGPIVARSPAGWIALEARHD